MKYTIPAYHTMSLALAVTGVFFGANLAIAQEVNEKIVIVAPYELTKVKSPTSAQLGLTTEIWELKRLVNIDDLDLTKYADVTKLNSRIESVAKESCQKLSDMFPLNPSNPVEMRRCKKKAIASTKKQTERAIAATK